MVKIDMEMPKTCGDCPFVFYAKNCALRIKVVKLNKKPDWCPLIEDTETESLKKENHFLKACINTLIFEEEKRLNNEI